MIASLGPLSAPVLTASVVALLALVAGPMLWRKSVTEDFDHSPIFRRLPWLAFAVTFAATVAAWGLQRRAGQAEAQQRMGQEIAQIQSAVEQRLKSYEDLLRLAAEQVGAESPQDPPAWELYVNSLHLPEKFPTISGFGYVTYARRDQLKKLLPTLKLAGGGIAPLSPAGERFDYFVIRLAEPDEKNRSLIGFDIGSNLVSRFGAEQARDGGGAALTAPMKLPVDSDRQQFLYLWPVFGAGKMPATVEGRLAALRGWIFARIHQDNLLKDLLPADDRMVRLQAYDGAAISAESLFFDSSGPVSSARPSAESSYAVLKPITAGGRHITLRFVPKPAFEGMFASNNPVSFFFWGVLFSGWSFAFVWLMVSVRVRAREVGREMTGELHNRQTALAAGPHAVLITDATRDDNPITFVSPRFEKITGYAASEVLGKNPRFLEGNDTDQKGLKEIRRAVKEQREMRTLIRNYRKDGTPFWNDLTLTPIRNDMGRVTHWSGVMHDVTEREQSERRLATQVAVIRALSESTQLSEASQRILQALCESQEWEFGTLWILDSRAGVLKCLETWHNPEVETNDFENFCRQTNFPKTVGVPGLVWGRHEPVWLEDLSAEPSLPEGGMTTRLGFNSACGFPIASRRGLLGVMAFYSRKIWPLNKNLLLLMVGAGAQISQFIERQQNKDQEKEINMLERGLAEYMGDGLLAMDRDGYCVFVNAAGGRLLGYAPRSILGENLHDLLHPAGIADADCAGSTCPLILSLQSTQPCFIDDHEVFFRQDKSRFAASFTTSPIINAGLIQGVVITFLDVSERRQRDEELKRELALKDREIMELRSRAETPLPTALPDPDEPPIKEGDLESEDEGAEEVNGPVQGTILLVEEDRTQRLQTAQTLRRKGFQILSASNAGEALLYGERKGDLIDLLITDLMTSHMTGKQLYQRLAGLCPRMKVLYTSVYSAKAVTEQGLLENGMPFLRKPFASDTVVPRIQQALR